MSDIHNNLLKNISKISPLTQDVWEEFKNYWHPVDLKKNEFLTQAGQIERFFYYVDNGIIRGYILNDSDEISIGFSYDGDYSGA